MAAAVDLHQISSDVERGAQEEPVGAHLAAVVLRQAPTAVQGPRSQINVLGESQGRQADGDGTGARCVHVAARRVPGELGMHVTVKGEHHKYARPGHP